MLINVRRVEAGVAASALLIWFCLFVWAWSLTLHACIYCFVLLHRCQYNDIAWRWCVIDGDQSNHWPIFPIILHDCLTPLTSIITFLYLFAFFLSFLFILSFFITEVTNTLIVACFDRRPYSDWTDFINLFANFFTIAHRLWQRQTSASWNRTSLKTFRLLRGILGSTMARWLIGMCI